jgi:alpha,alpha-trehalase
VLPHIVDDAYMVPGGRFGMELYYHDARINAPSARSTVEAAAEAGDVKTAESALSALRGTANALINEVLTYGKAMNASMTTSVGRSQPPCLTTVIKETYRAWLSLHPEQVADAKTWLGYALAAATEEVETVWMAEPRLDKATGLSRYVDETPSAAPEEAAHFYEGVAWSADDLRSDAAVREHGWDSMPGALLSRGPDRGKPRMHELLPVCLQCLLFRTERDLAALTRELTSEPHAQLAPATSAEAWEARAAARKETMDRLMWDPKKGAYFDLIQPAGQPSARPPRNGVEDLRSLMPLWAGVVEGESAKQKAMQARLREYLRPHGLATATPSAWLQAWKLNPAYVDRCQWGHKDIGWPIATWETVQGLRDSGAGELADEIAYRWCLSVQQQMDTLGGLHPDGYGGHTAPVFEKMNVSTGKHDGAAGVGYGNQGAGNEGENGGFRWGLDAYKLLARSLPPVLQEALRNAADPDGVFDARLRARG